MWIWHVLLEKDFISLCHVRQSGQSGQCDVMFESPFWESFASSCFVQRYGGKCEAMFERVSAVESISESPGDHPRRLQLNKRIMIPQTDYMAQWVTSFSSWESAIYTLRQEDDGQRQFALSFFLVRIINREFRHHRSWMILLMILIII